MMYRNTPGFVYFIAPVWGGLIKIGYSGQPKHRLANLLSWSPVDLEILATAPGTPVDERATHNLFIEQHHRNEWFKPCSALYALIDEVKETGKLPLRCIGTDETRWLMRCGPRGPYKRPFRKWAA